MMKSFQRVLGLFAVVIAPVLFIGCGGPGAPISGASDPAEEAAAAALAPEVGSVGPASETAEADTPKKAAEPEVAAPAPPENSEAASPNKSEK